jgi:hypothetical protein
LHTRYYYFLSLFLCHVLSVGTKVPREVDSLAVQAVLGYNQVL